MASWENAPVVESDAPKKSAWESAPTVEEISYSSEEYEPPTKNSAGQTLTPEARRMEKLVHDALSSGKGGSQWLKGAGETARALGEGVYRSAVGGIKGLFTPTKDGVGAAVAKIEKEQAKAYQPKTAEGKLLTNITGELLNAPTKMATMASEETGKALGVSDKTQAKMDLAAETAPSIIPMAGGLRSALTRGEVGAAKDAARIASKEARKADLGGMSDAGAKKLYEAMKDLTPEELKAAHAEMGKAQASGVPMVGGEAFKDAPALQELMLKADKSGNIVSSFLKNRPEKAKAVVEKRLNEIGEKVGTQDAVNAIEEGATKILENAEKARTEKASPLYEAQRASDAEAIGLMDDIKKTQSDISAGEVWKNDAVQQAGKWYAFSHEMGLKANEVAAKMKDWAQKDAQSAKAASTLEGEGGLADPRQAKIDTFMERAGEGKDATYAAMKEAKARQAYIDEWQKDLYAGQDALAAKKIPEIQGKVQELLSKLDAEIRLKGPTEEGKALSQLRNEIAPNGQPITLPSQLESVHKSNKNALELGLSPTREQRTAAGVLKSPLKDLDALIRDVSPDIAKGREIYEGMSNTVVNPLYKGVVGKLAGKGADAAKETAVARVMSELGGKNASPDRIRLAADKLNTYDPEIFPNWSRAYLEDAWDNAKGAGSGADVRAAGKKFVDAVAGTDNAKASLAAMVEKSAAAQGMGAREAHLAARGMLDLMDTLRNTTQLDRLGRQAIEEGPGVAEAAMGAANIAAHRVVGTTQSAKQWADAFLNKKAYENIAKVMTDKDALVMMERLARVGKNATEREGILRAILRRLGEDLTSADKAKALGAGVAADQMRSREPITVEVNGTANQNSEGAK